MDGGLVRLELEGFLKMSDRFLGLPMLVDGRAEI